CFLGGALVLELGNIGAGHERLAAGAGHDDDADAVIVAEIVENAGGRFPHVERDRVMAFRIVEDQIADAPVLARQHLVGLAHGWLLNWKPSCPALCRASTSCSRKKAWMAGTSPAMTARGPSLGIKSPCSGAASRSPAR